METYITYLVHLIKCAILDTQPNPIPGGIELNALIAFAQRHTVENIVYLSLKKLNLLSSPEMQLLEEYYGHAITVDATQQYYLEMIIDALEENKIRHCVMKGPVIKKLYPTSDMRRSGDLDIFVDDENTEKVKGIMESLGFTAENFNKANSHDEYKIDQNIIVEIHRTLISNQCPWQKPCQRIADRLILEDGCQYRYRMTDEDYYLYMIGHMAKHMKYSGIGIKMVLDVWIYLQKYERELNREQLNKHLKECGLYKFENIIRNVCDYWFNDKDADDLTKATALYIGTSGNFGTYEQLMMSRMGENALGTTNESIGRCVSYVKMFFWPYKNMRERYTILKKLPFLLPFFWIYRALNTLLFNKEKARHIREQYHNYDMDNSKQLIDFKKKIGL